MGSGLGGDADNNNLGQQCGACVAYIVIIADVLTPIASLGAASEALRLFLMMIMPRGCVGGCARVCVLCGLVRFAIHAIAVVFQLKITSLC